MKHIEQLAEIRVPCSQELKQDTAVQPESVEEMSNGGDSDSDTNTNHESSLCAQSEEETIEDASSLERMCVETKMDLNVAIDKGDKTVQKLRANNSKVLKDMEAFSLDEMDELFEDSDDTEIQLSTDETASTPHSSLPYSSLTSRESVESSGESSRIDELEIQAIKRHLQVSTGPVQRFMLFVLEIAGWPSPFCRFCCLYEYLLFVFAEHDTRREGESGPTAGHVCRDLRRAWHSCRTRLVLLMSRGRLYQAVVANNLAFVQVRT